MCQATYLIDRITHTHKHTPERFSPKNWHRKTCTKFPNATLSIISSFSQIGFRILCYFVTIYRVFSVKCMRASIRYKHTKIKKWISREREKNYSFVVIKNAFVTADTDICRQRETSTNNEQSFWMCTAQYYVFIWYFILFILFPKSVQGVYLIFWWRDILNSI